jgi:hypothetical protein
MSMVPSASLSTPSAGSHRHTGLVAGLKAFWRQFSARAFDPYRPELHYMRGPGPAWRARHGKEAGFRLKSGDL